MKYNEIVVVTEQIMDQIDELVELIGNMSQEMRMLEDGDNEVNLKEAIRIQIGEFLMYLAAADNNITDLEADYISIFLGSGASADNLHRYIEKNAATYVDYGKNVPIILSLSVQLDNSIIQQADDSHIVSPLILGTYAILAVILIYCGDVPEQQITKMNEYIGNLKAYIKENFDGDSDVVFKKANEFYEGIITNGEPIITVNLVEKKKNTENINFNTDIDSLMAELNELVGLKEVKEDVIKLINFLRIGKERELRGLKQVPTSKHLVFAGNPGTGKTTVARILAKIYKQMGLLSQGQLVEVDRAQLVGEYVGTTAKKTTDVINKALGGILFIDEAYTLSKAGSSNDYGIEAIDTILKAMEDNRDDFVVIVAGYPKFMEQFLESNPGLKSRFNKFINFEDYSPDEMLDIFERMCKKAGYTVASNVKEHLRGIFTEKYDNRTENFANAREVRNIFEAAVFNQANRLASDNDLTNEDLMELILDDFC